VSSPKKPEAGETLEVNTFPWKTYLDPKNKEFFKEGDYTPPEPFMEIARNPTDENIQNWFEFMKKKNELARRLDQRVREYMAKNGQALAVDHRPGVLVTQAKLQPPSWIPLDSERFKVRMYFESTCPHCKRMFGVLKRLQDKGIEVHALQIDRGPISANERIVPLGLATPEEVKKHRINGVPFLLVADTKRKALLPPIQGYHDFDEIVRLLKSASQ
ncbi:MAG: conjugal transfer protein TraF, partial [Bdellovibrionales bacterium]